MMLRFLLVLSVVALASCQSGPRPVRVGEECAHCRMQVMKPEMVAELVTRKGRQYVFDDLICLAQFLKEEQAVAQQADQLLVADYQQPSQWVNVDQATFVRSPQLRTPMNGQTVAFTSAAEARLMATKLNPPGEVLTWPNVRSILAR